MYCPTCGSHLAEGLSYCKHCGSSLRTDQNTEESRGPDKTIDSLVWVIVGTTITILGMFLGALVLMRDGRIDFALGTVFVILSFVAFLLVESVLVWRLLQLSKGTKKLPGSVQSTPCPDELSDVRTNALQEPLQSVPSVTEQTTRHFEPSLRKDNPNN